MVKVNQKNNVLLFENRSKTPTEKKEGNKLVSIIEVDWQKGFDAGLLGISQYPVPSTTDEYSWFSGWIEGSAKRN